MRKYINLIEAKSTKEKDKTDFDFLRGLETGGKEVANTTPKNIAVPGKKAKTKARNKPLNFEPEAAGQASQHFSSLSTHANDMQDTISDEEARRIAGVDDSDDDFSAVDAVGIPTNQRLAIGHTKTTTENLPAVIRKEVAKTDDNLIYPEWHQVKHLPNYIQQPIRALGRQVFGQFTDTPIEDIQMIGTIGGLNPDPEVSGMMNWIKQHGHRDHSANIDFSRIMPGYQADVSLWNVFGYQFLLVKDFMGFYIYGWSKGSTKYSIENNEPKRLTKESVSSKKKN